MDDVSTTCTVDINTPVFLNSYIIINSEIIKVTGISDLTLTIERGAIPAVHLINTVIYPYFNWTPFRDTENVSTYPVNRVEFENGNEQVQQQSINKIQKWSLPFQGLYEEMVAIKTFCDKRFGPVNVFKWTDTDNNIQTVRLANDNVEITEKRELQSTGWKIVAYTLKSPLVFRKVY